MAKDMMRFRFISGGILLDLALPLLIVEEKLFCFCFCFWPLSWRWWLRQGHASLRVTSSRGHASAKATVLMFAKLRASLMDIAEASVVDAFAVENAN
ncbi:hypothetical protein Dsin_022443 [Dipteronia sinensis]|uniref:Uncharacterized protein n=1 Tax=Dipteronia sinensis TaxID=43782 RepID=A0AAE0DZT0_9ROSI|nr:hypothetical protein Dsin_022443 [Dipteronia sinensis]